MAEKLSMSDGRDKKLRKFLPRKEFYLKYVVPSDEKTINEAKIYLLR